jgi:phage gp36-like protein
MRQTIKIAIGDAMTEAAETIAQRVQEAITEAALEADGTLDDERYNRAIEAANETITPAMIAAEAVYAAADAGNITEEARDAWERGQSQ